MTSKHAESLEVKNSIDRSNQKVYVQHLCRYKKQKQKTKTKNKNKKQKQKNKNKTKQETKQNKIKTLHNVIETLD